MAADGWGCTSSARHNDISSRIGLTLLTAARGGKGDCSASGHWSGDNRVPVWARSTAYQTIATSTTTAACKAGDGSSSFAGQGPWPRVGIDPNICNETYVQVAPKEHVKCGTVSGMCMAACTTSAVAIPRFAATLPEHRFARRPFVLRF